MAKKSVAGIQYHGPTDAFGFPIGTQDDSYDICMYVESNRRCGVALVLLRCTDGFCNACSIWHGKSEHQSGLTCQCLSVVDLEEYYDEYGDFGFRPNRDYVDHPNGRGKVEKRILQACKSLLVVLAHTLPVSWTK